MTSIVGREPKYMQLKNIVLDQIRDGAYAPGARILSENELAAKYGVSKHTVLKAITALVHEGVIYRQQGKGTFVADRVPAANTTKAERVRHGSLQGAIGVVMPVLNDEPGVSPTARLLAGITLALEEDAEERQVLFRNSANDPEREARQIASLAKAGIAGVILYPGYLSMESLPESVRILQENRIPFVLVDHDCPEVETDFVGTHDELGALELTSHLVKNGFKSVAHVTLQRNWFDASRVAQDRASGYRNGLKVHGIAPKEAYLKYREYDDCSLVLDELLSESTPPDAIFASDAHICLQLYKGLRQRGIAIPGRMALAGFDDVPVAKLLDIPLTMIAQPLHSVGGKAAQLLLERINAGAGASATPQKVRLVPRLQRRASTTKRN